MQDLVRVLCLMDVLAVITARDGETTVYHDHFSVEEAGSRSAQPQELHGHVERFLHLVDVLAVSCLIVVSLPFKAKQGRIHGGFAYNRQVLFGA